MVILSWHIDLYHNIYFNFTKKNREREREKEKERITNIAYKFEQENIIC